MKTRCRSYGSRQRMTVSSSVVSTHDTSERKEQSAFDSSDDILCKEPLVIHETRSQKHAKVNGQHDEHAETKEPSPQRSEISSTNIRVSTRSSARPQKRQKKSNSSPQPSINQDGQQSINTTPQQQKGKKVKRQWESWGLEDKNAFFDALHEHGKDFDKIQAHLLARHKRRGDPVNLIKNKDQVRHFYYRTLNKISKFIPKDKQPTTETDPHRRTMLELGGLTCYGELRKKGGGLGDKQGKKLYELMADGRTIIRHNGRTIRIKAPTCRALKKLISTDTTSKSDETTNHPPPIPAKINVEFLPSDNATWLAVQGIAKNPRLKTTVSSKKPLHIILEFLMKKWPVKSPTSKTNEVLTICITIPVGFFTMEEEPNNITCDIDIADDTTNDVETETDIVNKTVNEDSGAGNSESLNNGELNSTDLISTQSNSKESTCTSVAGSMEDTTNPKQWTSETCGNLTIGDIYCKLQRPPKLKFEYSFQEGEISTTKHCHNSLQKLVDVAKNEFHSFKNREVASKPLKSGGETAGTAKNAMPAPSYSATRNMRKAPKTTNKLPFILPSIVPSALRQGLCQPGLPTLTTTINSNTTTSFVNTRKRPRKNQLPVPQPQKVIQRTLLPRPANAMPRGAVAVSFIPQPVESMTSVPSPMSGTVPVSDGTSRPSSNASSSKPAQMNSSASPATTTVHSPSPAPSPASSVTPISSPDSSTIITTVLETGVQQPSALTNETLNEGQVSVTQDLLDTIVTSQESIPQKTLSTGLSEYVRHSDVDQLVNSLQQFTSSSTSNGLDSVMDFSTNTVRSTIQLDPVVSINEDSGSELLASIMGLHPFTQTTTSTSVAPDTTANTEKSTDGQVQEMNSAIAGCSSFSFSTPSFHNILSSSNNEAIMSVSTTTTSSLFFNSGSENSSDAFNANGSGNLFTSPHLSPMPSPTTESQWLNGEVSDISLGFLDKMTISPDKDPKFGFETPGAALFSSANKDTSSQDSLFGSKSMIETSQAERAFQAIMDENSVDFVKKFEDLAKQISNDKPLVFSGENSSDSSNSSSGILSFKNVLGSKT